MYDTDTLVRESDVARECPACSGRGEVALNDPRDPADLLTAECGHCSGTGAL